MPPRCLKCTGVFRNLLNPHFWHLNTSKNSQVSWSFSSRGFPAASGQTQPAPSKGRRDKNQSRGSHLSMGTYLLFCLLTFNLGRPKHLLPQREGGTCDHLPGAVTCTRPWSTERQGVLSALKHLTDERRNGYVKKELTCGVIHAVLSCAGLS